MTEPEPRVLVVDDDDSLRRGLEKLMRSVSLSVETFASAPELSRSVPSPLALYQGVVRLGALAGSPCMAPFYTPFRFITRRP
jgi:FixJ family two-component response regulator